jgi:hypothetical protein
LNPEFRGERDSGSPRSSEIGIRVRSSEEEVALGSQCDTRVVHASDIRAR